MLAVFLHWCVPGGVPFGMLVCDDGIPMKAEIDALRINTNGDVRASRPR